MSILGQRKIRADNAFGNVRQILDSSDNVVAYYEYDPFGKLISKGGTYADANRYRHATKPYDEDTGLYYYTYRHYNPESGRWINRDPIAEAGGLTLYAYCFNNSINLWDLWGWSISYKLYENSPAYGDLDNSTWVSGDIDISNLPPNTKVSVVIETTINGESTTIAYEATTNSEGNVVIENNVLAAMSDLPSEVNIQANYTFLEGSLNDNAITITEVSYMGEITPSGLDSVELHASKADPIEGGKVTSEIIPSDNKLGDDSLSISLKVNKDSNTLTWSAKTNKNGEDGVVPRNTEREWKNKKELNNQLKKHGKGNVRRTPWGS